MEGTCLAARVALHVSFLLLFPKASSTSRLFFSEFSPPTQLPILPLTASSLISLRGGRLSPRGSGILHSYDSRATALPATTLPAGLM